MKTTHTPGPWIARPTASLGPQFQVYPENDGHDIAIIYDHGNAEANARLIAAAPDLLATLQLDVIFHSRPFTKNSLADFKAAGYTGTEDGKEMRAWLESVKLAAIAKATGKASL